MAGSIKWMVYASDSGQQYAARVDESNGEATGFADITAANTGLPQMPRSMKMRYVNGVRVDGGVEIKRRIKFGTIAAMNAAVVAGSVTLADGTYSVRSFRGERSAVVFALDTSQNDGDDT